jgi:PAS domain S-box-containing protein
VAVKSLSNTKRLKKKDGKNIYIGKPIIETIPNGFFTVDHNGTVKYLNKAAEELLHVRAKDIVGKNLSEKFTGVIPRKLNRIYKKAFLNDIPVHFEEYWNEMGAWFDVITFHGDDTFSVSFKSSNHPTHPEQQLKALNELYRFVTEVTNDCLWEWNLQAKEIFWIDGGHQKVFGYQIENALIPQSFWEDHLHPDDKARILTRFNKIINTGSNNLWEDEYRFKKINGEYAYVHDRGQIIYEGVKASRMIGASQDITSRKLAEIELINEKESKQREITAAVLTAQENERASIGRELHDNLNQLLSTAKLYIEMSKRDDENRQMYLEKSSEYIITVIEEIRRISKTLASPGFHLLGLFDNIKILIDDLSVADPIKIEFSAEGVKEKHLNKRMQLDIFRIVQEQLNNILKHAKATRAFINLTKMGNEIILLISDNGQGYDILKENQGVGIINIKSRVDIYHGRVTIASESGKGYELKVVLPMNSGI